MKRCSQTLPSLFNPNPSGCLCISDGRCYQQPYQMTVTFTLSE